MSIADEKNQFGMREGEAETLEGSTLIAARCNDPCPFNNGAGSKIWKP